MVQTDLRFAYKCMRKNIPSLKLSWLLLVWIFFFTPGLVAQTGKIWPSFHGSDRLNKSMETDLMKTWPAEGPALLFSISGLGEGYSAAVIGEDALYTAGKLDDQTYVFAFDLKGNLLWKKPNGAAWNVEVSWASAYNGPRSTPTYDQGMVFHLSEAGRLTAYRARTGEEIWAKEMTRDFGAPVPMYGFSESVLVEGDHLYVRPAGIKGFQLCLDKNTGDLIWANTTIPGTYGYNSLVPYDFGGYHQLVGASSNCYYGVDSKTGTLLWKVDFENKYGLNCTDAIIYEDQVLIANGVGGGCMLVKLTSEGGNVKAEKVYQHEWLDNYHGGLVLQDGLVYGAGCNVRNWYCMDFKTGNVLWKEPGVGCLTYADGMLYLLDENGSLRLVSAKGDRFEKNGEMKVPRGGKGPFWAHPVVCDGRLYIRQGDKLMVYGVRK